MDKVSCGQWDLKTGGSGKRKGNWKWKESQLIWYNGREMDVERYQRYFLNNSVYQFNKIIQKILWLWNFVVQIVANWKW